MFKNQDRDYFGLVSAGVGFVYVVNSPEDQPIWKF